jgi:GrpB-like predicted nucleotidyltransferase (UPF0157 family)
MRKVEVVPHNPDWNISFKEQFLQLAIALGNNAIAIHHIGSTAIHTVYAKPIIDILVEVKDLLQVENRSGAIESLDYIAMGEFGIPERRFFLKDNHLGIRTHHLHIFETGSPQIDRHLAFRDYLRCHYEDALKYSTLKYQLAQQFPSDIQGYLDGKNEFIQEIDRRAATWQLTMNNR